MNERAHGWQVDAALGYVMACLAGQCPRLMGRAGEAPDPEFLRWIDRWLAVFGEPDSGEDEPARGA